MQHYKITLVLPSILIPIHKGNLSATSRIWFDISLDDTYLENNGLSLILLSENPVWHVLSYHRFFTE